VVGGLGLFDFCLSVDVSTVAGKMTANGLLVEPKDNSEITPLVKSLSGIISLPKNSDGKKDYKKHLLNKYSK